MMNKSKRFFVSRSSSFFPFHLPLTFFILYPSSLILFFFPLWRSASRQVRDLAEELPYWVDRHYAILFSSFLLTLG